MGVYVFRSLNSDWIKVGHHKITKARPNVYYRIAGRGFHSCVHPRELEGKLHMHNFELVAWYPQLDRSDERAIHRRCATSYGEFHSVNDLDAALDEANRRGGTPTSVSASDRNQAIAWAGKRCKAIPS